MCRVTRAHVIIILLNRPTNTLAKKRIVFYTEFIVYGRPIVSRFFFVSPSEIRIFFDGRVGATTIRHGIRRPFIDQRLRPDPEIDTAVFTAIVVIIAYIIYSMMSRTVRLSSEDLSRFFILTEKNRTKIEFGYFGNVGCVVNGRFVSRKG